MKKICFVAILWVLIGQIPGADQKIERPDLVIEEIKVEPMTPVIYPRNRVQVRIILEIKNDSVCPTAVSLTSEGLKNNCQGQFRLLLEGITGPSEEYKKVLETTVAALAGKERQTITHSEWVIFGEEEVRTYRATIDSLNWIEEKNETNNTASTDFSRTQR